MVVSRVAAEWDGKEWGCVEWDGKGWGCVEWDSKELDGAYYFCVKGQVPKE
jgi:hypothetical protein